MISFIFRIQAICGKVMVRQMVLFGLQMRGISQAQRRVGCFLKSIMMCYILHRILVTNYGEPMVLQKLL